MTFEELQKLTLDWADDKDLLHSENAPKQFMKTKEFVRRVEELGYKVHYAPESILVYDEYGITYVKILPYQHAISTIGDGFYTRKKHKELYKLCFEYSATPINDRK